MTSATIYTVLLCYFLFNFNVSGLKIERDLYGDESDSLDNGRREALTKRKFPVNRVIDGYCKDAYNIYYMNNKITEASYSSFEPLGDGYAKDTWNAYYMGQKVPGATSSSFQILYYGYAKDTWNAYFMGKKIPEASASSFHSTGGGFAKDNWNTYYGGQKI